MSARLRITVLAVACALPMVAALGARQQVRDSPDIQVTGTGTISGVVVTNDEAAQPVRRATLTLNSTGRGRGSGGLTVSDDAGAFAFHSLPPGRYTLGGAKPGWLGMQYGATRYGSGGITMVLAAGQQLTNIRMRMTHGAAITGQIFGQSGYLPQDIQVRAETVQNIDGERRLSGAPSGPLIVDERGVYRIFGLPAGDYVIMATFENSGIDLRTATEEELLWAQRLLKRPVAESSTPTLSTAPPPMDAPPTPSPRVGYAPVYFPGTTDPARAEIVTLGAGDERAGADFSLRMSPMGSMRFTVHQPDGRPVNNTQIDVRRGTGDSGSYNIDQRNGSFLIERVPPGEYHVRVQAWIDNGPKTDKTLLWATTDVSVDGRDLPIEDLVLRPSMTLSGRISATDAPAGVPLERFNVQLDDATPNDAMSANPSGKVLPDGTFTLRGVTPGRYYLRGSPVAGWSTVSASIDGRDALDAAFEIGPGVSPTTALVTFSQGATQLSGTMLDATGTPTADYFIVVFATKKELWRSNSRWVARARPDTDGKWRIANLPPGEYYLCALDSLVPADLANAAFLAQIAPASMRLTLAPGEKKIQDLKAGK